MSTLKHFLFAIFFSLFFVGVCLAGSLLGEGATCGTNNGDYYTTVQNNRNSQTNSGFCSGYVLANVPTFPTTEERIVPTNSFAVGWTCDQNLGLEWGNYQCEAVFSTIPTCGDEDGQEYNSEATKRSTVSIGRGGGEPWCAGGVISGGVTPIFPSAHQRTETIITERDCINRDGDSVACANTVHMIPTCGANAKNYITSETGWVDPQSTGFCAVGDMVEAYVSFPSPLVREQMITFSWTCKNSVNSETVSCEANIPPYPLPTCGSEDRREYGMEDTTRFTEEFCARGSFKSGGLSYFPSESERTGRIENTRECVNNYNDPPVSCTNTIYSITKCGENKGYYHQNTTGRRVLPGGNNTGFCEVGHLVGSPPSFPSKELREVEETIIWECENENSETISCEAQIAPYPRPTCGGEHRQTYGMNDESWNYDERCLRNTTKSGGLVYFPSANQRTGTFSNTWQCTNDNGEYIACQNTIYSIPDCGQNTFSYGPISIGWHEEASTGFCAVGSLVNNPNGTLPFPSVSEREGGKDIFWQCQNENMERVDCQVSIPELQPCGPNRKEYTSFESMWKMGKEFPYPYDGFCLVGIPGWQSTIAFPSIDERDLTETSRTWYCEVDGDTSATCTADIAPVHNAQCGPNATEFGASKTQWKGETNTGFCEIGYFNGDTDTKDFPRKRPNTLIKTWECLSPDIGRSVQCQATLFPNEAECADFSAESVLNVSLIPKERFCNNGILFNLHNVGLQQPRERYCQTFSSDDGQLVDQATCQAHKSCTRNGYEYTHNEETVPTIIDGQCGTADGYNFGKDEYGYSDDHYQCRSGSPSNLLFPDIDTRVSWVCEGVNGGLDSEICRTSRYLPIPGKCGNADQYIFLPQDIQYTQALLQCDEGISTNTNFPEIGSTVSWKCLGKYGGESEVCRATRVATGTAVDGVCGGAQGHNFNVDDVWYDSGHQQCASGIPVNIVSGTHTPLVYTSTVLFPQPSEEVQRFCKGINSGEDSGICSATRSIGTPITGACGTADYFLSGYFASSTTHYGGRTLCASGTATISSTTFPKIGSSISWTCMGEYGGADDVCIAVRTGTASVNVNMGTADGYTFAHASGGFTDGYQPCEDGIAMKAGGGSYLADFPIPGERMEYECFSTRNPSNPNLTGRTQRSLNGSCGSANGEIFLVGNGNYGSFHQCRWNETYTINEGTPTDDSFPATGTQISRKCPGRLGGSDSATCTARRLAGPQPQDGVCGSADGHIFTPIDIRYTTDHNQCEQGMPSTLLFPQRGETLTRQCIGANGGQDSPVCETSRADFADQVYGACGVAHEYTFEATDTGYDTLGTTGVLCTSGTPTITTGMFPDIGQSISWTCQGWGGGEHSEVCWTYRDPGMTTYQFATGGVTQRYSTDMAPVGSTCDDVLVNGLLTCDDGVRMSGTQVMQQFAQNCEDQQNQTCLLNGKVLQHGESQTLYQYEQRYFGQTGCAIGDNQATFTCERGELTEPENKRPQDYPYFSCEDLEPRDCQFGPQVGQMQTFAHEEIFQGYKQEYIERDQDCQATGTNGNMALLSCFDGTVSLHKDFGSSTLDDYTYLQCQTNEPKDCVFQGQTIAHGDAVTGRNVEQAQGPDQTCQSQTRICTDGNLSGTYQYDHCGIVDGQCGSATGRVFDIQPRYNLCREGKLHRPDTSAVTSDEYRTWQCLGYGGSDATCLAHKPEETIMPEGVCGTSIQQYEEVLIETMDTLCDQGRTTGFTTSITGWTWSCQGRTFTDTCAAFNTTKPSGTIVYDTTTPTDGAVVATVQNFTLPNTTITNNSGSQTYLFDHNGTFVFELEADGKTNVLTAQVDRINNRTSLFQNLLAQYEDNYCSLYQGVSFDDLRNNPFTTDIVTMLNTCVMHGYQFKNKDLFLPHNRLTRLEALTAMSRLGAAITYYYGDRIDDPRRDEYLGVMEEDEIAAHLVWGNKIGLVQYLDQGFRQEQRIPAQTPLSAPLFVFEPTAIPQGTLVSSGTRLGAYTKFIKGTDYVETDPEILSGRELPGTVRDERNSELREAYTYDTGWTLDKDIVASPGTVFLPGTVFPEDITLHDSGVVIALDKPITLQEFQNMMKHFLRLHELDPDRLDRVLTDLYKINDPKARNEDVVGDAGESQIYPQRNPNNIYPTDHRPRDLDQQYLTRGETAFILRRIMEPYNKIPIGNDYLLLNGIYEYTKHLDALQMEQTLTQIWRAISRMPMSLLTKYGLTRGRLLQDLNAIKNNTLPPRKEKQVVDTETLRNRRQDRWNVDAMYATGNVEFYTRDRYDELEF